MTRLSTIVIDGKCYPWRDIQRLRREQLAAWAAERQAAQPQLLGGLPDMCRPQDERTPAGRYYAERQESLLPLLETITHPRERKGHATSPV
jgi:hypothetical protein